ncbi:hypothetical protein M0Q39_06195 [Patescibacteria group bacterium]|nr:hypothetical protein [Patescibacteria group bacterium]
MKYVRTILEREVVKGNGYYTGFEKELEKVESYITYSDGREELFMVRFYINASNVNQKKWYDTLKIYNNAYRYETVARKRFRFLDEDDLERKSKEW